MTYRELQNQLYNLSKDASENSNIRNIKDSYISHERIINELDRRLKKVNKELDIYLLLLNIYKQLSDHNKDEKEALQVILNILDNKPVDSPRSG